MTKGILRLWPAQGCGMRDWSEKPLGYDFRDGKHALD